MTDKRKPQPLWKKIAKWLSLALTLAIVALIIAIPVAKLTGNLLFIFNHTVVYVVSESMEPTISAHSFIILEKISAEDVEVGDVIMFISDDPSISGEYNTHQVMEIVGDHEEFVTKGTNNPVEDAYTARAENVRGRYVGNATLLTKFSQWFLSKTGLIVTLFLIVIISCAVYLPDLLKKSAGGKTELTEEEKEKLIQEKIREEIARLQEQQNHPETENNQTTDEDKTE